MPLPRTGGGFFFERIAPGRMALSTAPVLRFALCSKKKSKKFSGALAIASFLCYTLCKVIIERN